MRISLITGDKKERIMSIKSSHLSKYVGFDKVIIHALDLALYQVSVELNGEEHYVVDYHDRPIRSHNILSLQKLFDGIQVGQMRLQHQSAYDEMIGQPTRSSNLLDVPLGNNKLY